MVDVSTLTHLVEAAGLAVVALYLWTVRRDGWREFVVIALAGFLAEESSMLLYGYYGYNPHWVLVIHRTPLAVALIWPLVVLSSLQIARRIQGLSRAGLAASSALLVLYDTVVLEPVATRAGLWWWKDGTYFGVPFLGVVGWGIFAAAAAVVLSRGRLIRGWAFAWIPLAIVVLTQAVLGALAFPSIHYNVTLPISHDGYAWSVAAWALVALPISFWLRRRLYLTLGMIRFKIAGAAIFFAMIYGLWLEPFVFYCSLVPLPYWVLTLFRSPSEVLSAPSATGSLGAAVPPKDDLGDPARG